MRKNMLVAAAGIAISCMALPAIANAQLVYCPFVSSGVCSGTLGASLVFVGGATTAGGSLNMSQFGGYAEFNQHVVPTSGSVTVAFWARLFVPTTGAFREFVSQGSSGLGFYMGMEPGGNLRLTDFFPNTGVPTPTDGGFHHYAFTTDATSFTRLYVDGVVRGTATIGISTGAGGTNTRLGRQFGAFNEFTGAQMNDFVVYDDDLDNAQVAALASRRGSLPPPPPPPVSTVPEPASLALMSSGLLALLAVLKKRRRI